MVVAAIGHVLEIYPIASKHLFTYPIDRIVKAAVALITRTRDHDANTAKH